MLVNGVSVLDKPISLNLFWSGPKTYLRLGSIFEVPESEDMTSEIPVPSSVRVLLGSATVYDIQ